MKVLRVLAAALILSAGMALAQSVTGVSNFHQINDRIYRGAQPATFAYQNLAQFGIKTVVDLRNEPGQIRAEEKAVRAAGMKFVSIPMSGLSAPTAQQIAQVLALLNDESAGPVFVHCRRGADRTGTVIACYRIAAQHWEQSKALAEAKSFGMSFVERGMRHYVLTYQPPPAVTPTVAAAPPASPR